MDKDAKFTIVHKDEMERNGKWFLARRALDLKSFGMNLVDIPAGEQIPEHNELKRDQEEVFIFWKGDGVMVIEGKEYPAKEGTFVRLDPEFTRTVKNTSGETITVLITSAPRTSGYRPMEWA